MSERDFGNAVHYAETQIAEAQQKKDELAEENRRLNILFGLMLCGGSLIGIAVLIVETILR